MKGVVLLGGTGTRLFPITKSINKHLLPIYNKPMVYYPISTLMLAGIKELILVTRASDANLYTEHFGDGSHLGMNISYVIQNEPKGIVDALQKAISHLEPQPICLILGDNIFYGTEIGKSFIQKIHPNKITILAYHVSNPTQYGVVEFSQENVAVSIEEKPQIPKSNWAIPGIYFLPESIFDEINNIDPSSRNELEITSLLRIYLDKQLLQVEKLSRGIAWLDTGTFEGLHEASSFVKTIEERQGNKLAMLEEIAYRNGWISRDQLLSMVESYTDLSTKEYLQDLLAQVTTFE